jgi:Ca2+-binding RTX toxin-like protein
LIDATHSPPGQVRPSAEDDVILGMKGNDTIYGLDGNDRIDGGAGIDTLYGGEGNDTFEVLGKDGLTDIINGGNGSDTVKALGTASLVLAGFNTVTSSIEHWQGNNAGLLGDKLNDTFDFSGLASMTGVPFVDGGKGNDTITGSDFADDLRGNVGNDILNGGDGNDRLTGGADADTINGGEGDDTIVVAGKKDGVGDVYNGGNGSDTFAGTGVTLANFDAAASSIEHWVGANTALLGDNANNTFDFSYLQSVTGLTFIDGGKGNDTITGSRFNDDLRGNAGLDRLEGGEGNDVLAGGKDADTFVFRADFGHDRITDFTITGTAQDFIAFDQAVFADFTAVMAAAAQNGANVVITLDADNSLTLNNIQLAALTAGDFQFI